MEYLTPNEKKVLLALNNLKKASSEQLSEKSNLKVEAAMQSAFMLQEKDLVSIEESVEEFYSLTEEGKEYAKSGLPERQIINFLNSRLRSPYPRDLKEIKKQFPPDRVNIALGWLKKKNWIKIENGKLVPTGKSEEGEDEKILKILPAKSSQIKIQKKTLKDLMNRNLIVVEKKKYRTISLTEKGIALVNKGITIEEEIAQLTPELIRSGGWKNKLRFYDIYAPAQPIYPAKIHPYQRLINKMRQIFLEMGFTEIKGDIVQSSFWNFDALFQPQDHPAREMQDTFYLNTKEKELPEVYKKVKKMHEHGGDIDSTGWGGTWSESLARQQVLRTHTTAITIKYLYDHPEPPVKAFCIDRVYRRETIDPTHTPEFEQLEGVVMDEGMSFRNLLGCLTEFYHRMGFKDIRFRPAYFPYTEPSVEPEVYIDGIGWMELGGAGIFRREVTAPLGIEYPVLAWGLGVSRVAMLKLGLKDLRELYQSDINWIRKSPVVMTRPFQ